MLEHCILCHTSVTSEFILTELREKLVDKFKYTPEQAGEVELLLRSRMEIVTPANLETPVCRDSDDDNILAAAIDGDCDCIITGDKDLLVLKQLDNINIFSPSDFPSHEKI